MNFNKNTSVYIDYANLLARCKQDNLSINYRKFFTYLSEKFNTKEIIIFTGYFKDKETEYVLNKEIGFKYVFKEIIYSKEESKIKANCDVDIVIKCVRDVYDENTKPNAVVLITSDGDFASLIKFWQEKSINIKIVSPASPDRCSYLLKKTNVSIIYLRQIIQHFINEKALDEDGTS